MRAAELRVTVDALLKRAESWRPLPRGPDDGPPAPDELLLIVLRSKRAANTRRLYARELAMRGSRRLRVCSRRSGRYAESRPEPLSRGTASVASSRWASSNASAANPPDETALGSVGADRYRLLRDQR